VVISTFVSGVMFTNGTGHWDWGVSPAQRNEAASISQGEIRTPAQRRGYALSPITWFTIHR
jgi:hypothetical protein